MEEKFDQIERVSPSLTLALTDALLLSQLGEKPS